MGYYWEFPGVIEGDPVLKGGVRIEWNIEKCITLDQSPRKGAKFCLSLNFFVFYSFSAFCTKMLKKQISDFNHPLVCEAPKRPSNCVK